MAAPRHCSVFELSKGFFDGCRLLPTLSSSLSFSTSLDRLPPSSSPPPPTATEDAFSVAKGSLQRCTCNICRKEFDCLYDQRLHFKSDLHRLNVKLSLSGKDVIEEEEFEQLVGDVWNDKFDVSSISGSDEDVEKGFTGHPREGLRQKLYLRLLTEDTVYVWRCLLLDEHNDNVQEETEIITRLNNLIHEPRNGTCFRIVLLASGGHFAGCVFDGNAIVTHKTFHRYVVRAKAGKKQSSKDATGKQAHSAGSSLRRYNETALKKEIQELLTSWKRYIDFSSSIFISVSPKNRQMFFNAEKPLLGYRENIVRHVPLTVRRPTLKEARRIYNTLTGLYEVNEKEMVLDNSSGYVVNDGHCHQQLDAIQFEKKLSVEESSSESDIDQHSSDKPSLSNSTLIENDSFALHEASKSGDAQQVTELLKQGLDPVIKDSRGRTPYVLASNKEVRNAFRRFMALNLDMWDWQAAKVSSPLTEEMEESQAAKKAEKDAKRKARAKELKKMHKAKEKAKAEAASSQNESTSFPKTQDSGSSQQPQQLPALERRPRIRSLVEAILSKEEEKRQVVEKEREERAAAAERRIASARQANSSQPPVLGISRTAPGDLNCSFCNASLAGKVPFHRYDYKYCSSSCMHFHREVLEAG